MKILVDKKELENALQLIINIGTKEYTVEEISSILNIVAYILGKMIDDTQNTSPLITPEELTQIVDEVQKYYAKNNKEDLTKEVLLELLLVIGEYYRTGMPIICQRSWDLYGKLIGAK